MPKHCIIAKNLVGDHGSSRRPHRCGKNVKPTPATSTSENQLKWWRQQAVVYFIAAGVPPIAIKIGVTQWSRAKTRIGACQTGNHEVLALLGVIPFREGEFPLKAAEDKERLLHEKFRDAQRFPEDLRGHEWFDATSELLEFIRLETRPPEEFGFVRQVSVMKGSRKTLEQASASTAGVLTLAAGASARCIQQSVLPS